MSKDIFDVFKVKVKPFTQISASEFKATNIMNKHTLYNGLTWKLQIESKDISRYAIFIGLYWIVYVFSAS